MAVQERNSELVDILTPDFSRSNHIHSGGGGVSLALNDLTDVTIVAAALGDYLRNDGVGQWVDVAITQLLTDLLTVDGTGSLLDADLLDGQDAASFQPIDPTLTALAAFNTNGLLTQTAADTFAGRTLIAPAAGITITNPDGVAGNPTFALANDLAGLEGLASTGLAVRSATDTWVQRSIAAGTALGVTNGNGVSGNPTVAVTDVELLALAGLTSATDQLPYFTGSGTAALTTLTAFIRTLLDDATQLAAQTTLGVVPGTDVQPQDATLTALAAFNTNGLLTQTAADTFTGRTIIAPAAGITVTDGNGVAGNPTLVLANDLLALEGLGSTGLAARTATDTWAQRTLTAPATGFTITNPAGIAGNPTFVLANDLAALEGLGSTGIAVRSAADTWVQRTITAGAALGVTDGNGVSSNPIVALTDIELLAIAGLTSAANQLPYFTGSGTAALTTLTSFIRTLLDDATQGAAQATLGITPGTDTQPFDAFLTSIALLGTAADKMIYTTAVDTAAETGLSAFARSFLDDASEAVFKATVNLEIGVDVQAWDADLDALAALAATAGLLARTGAGAFAVRTVTAPAAGITVTNGTGAAGNPTLVLANDLAGVEGLSTTGLAVRSATDTWLTRSIASGTAITVTNGDGVSGNPSVAVSDVELLAIAGLTSAADSLPYFTGSGTAALTTLTSFIRTLLDDANQAAAQATLGIAIGTNVQAFDAFLTSIALLGTAADRMIYTTGVDTAAETVLTSFSRTLLDDADAATARTTLGLIAGGAGDIWVEKAGDTMSGALSVIVNDAATNAIGNTETLGHNSSGTPAAGLGAGLRFQGESSTTVDQDMARIASVWTTVTHASRTADIVFQAVNGAAALAEVARFTASGALDVLDPATTRSNLGLVIGTNVQAWDADLDALAALAATAGMLSRTGAGAFAVRTLTAPAAGITISNPTGAAGNPTWALANDLAAVEGLSTNGLATRTATDTWTTRSLIAPAAGITVTNGDGVSGNPTLVLANDLAALEGLGSTGLAARTATDAWAQRTLTAPAAGFTITNPAGVAGNPTFVLADDLSALEGLGSTGIAVRSAANTWVQRTITAGDNILIANGSGVAANPIITSVSPFDYIMRLPVLRAFWPMSVVDSDGNPVDITGNGQHMIRQGNPTYAMHSPIPYIAMDGTGDYLRRTTEPQLEINANTFSGGLAVCMFGGWFWVNNATAEYTLMAKDDRAGQRSFRLYRTTGSLLGATIGTSGGAEGTATSGTWFFAALTLFGSGLRSFLNGTFSSQVTPLSITTTTAPFTIGGDGAGTQLLPGRAALCFLCNASNDAALIDVYDNTRDYFGV